MNDVLRMINERGIAAGELKLTPAYLAEIIKLVDANTVNTSTGKALLEKVQASGQAPGEIVQAEGLAKVSDQDAIRSVCAEVLAEAPEQVAAYQAGQDHADRLVRRAGDEEITRQSRPATGADAAGRALEVIRIYTSMHSSYLYLNDLRVHYLRWDAADHDYPVVLLHGLSSSARIWELVAPYLASKGLTCYAPDARGHGFSDQPEDSAENYSFSSLTSDLAAFLETCQLERPLLVGHSWGGMLALDYAARMTHWEHVLHVASCW